MVRGSKIKGMVMLLLFLGTAIVYAAPTMNDSVEDGVVFAESTGLYVYPCYRWRKAPKRGPGGAHLRAVISA